MKSNNLTNVRTFLQFSQYGDVKQIDFNGNKLMAMNTIRSMFGVKQFSILSERITDNFLPIGNYTILN
jgi:hypothetical protein